MSYRIEQDQTYLGNDRWRWRTWIGAPGEALDRIAKVTWLLHHSFPQPVVETIDRRRRFRIERSGWGAFQIRAELELLDGPPEQLNEWLRLSYPDQQGAPVRGVGVRGTPPPGPSRPPGGPRVFLSYGSEDAGLAAQLKAEMQQRGFDVRDAAEIRPGEPLKAAVQKMIRESDLVLGLVTSELTSPYVIEELNAAEQSATGAIAVIGPQAREPLGLLQGLRRLDLDLHRPGAAPELAERLINEPQATK